MIPVGVNFNSIIYQVELKSQVTGLSDVTIGIANNGDGTHMIFARFDDGATRTTPAWQELYPEAAKRHVSKMVSRSEGIKYVRI